jgi:hypothetical protein
MEATSEPKFSTAWCTAFASKPVFDKFGVALIDSRSFVMGQKSIAKRTPCFLKALSISGLRPSKLTSKEAQKEGANSDIQVRSAGSSFLPGWDVEAE